MTTLLPITFAPMDIDALATLTGKITVLMTADGTLDLAARRVNRLTRGALARLAESDTFKELEPGKGHVLSMPAGMAADAVQVVKIDRNADAMTARKAGAAAAMFKGKSDLCLCAASHKRAADLAYGLALRSYEFTAHKTGEAASRVPGPAQVMCAKPDEATAEAAPMLAVAEGVLFTRDLVSEPANVLNTTEFAERLVAMTALGLEVEVLEEADLEALGMRTLLAVGQGSRSPTKMVVMHWKGGKDEAPFALVGKGVVFDTGGISMKPAAGMEDMTMDMGGAGTVAGVMRALALRKAKANVVGLVGLVENMPDGNAQRPGDIVRSMKGDTIEVLNTDAEGRLVLADVLWYAQERFKPTGIVNLATLTGAIIVSLGHENAGVFSNNDALADAFLACAKAEEEGAWRMPMGKGYDKLLKSQVADVANIGGRNAGAITAAQFIRRFVREDMPWVHLDIAGTASMKSETDFAPKGATGWGVRSLDRLIRDRYEV